MSTKKLSGIRKNIACIIILILSVSSFLAIAPNPQPNKVIHETTISSNHMAPCIMGIQRSLSEETISGCKAAGEAGAFRNFFRNGNRALSFLIFLFLMAQMFFVCTCVEHLLKKSISICRFSIILFLHLSDGKKSPQFIL